MFKHITAITCVIKPLVDCFLNNPSPVIYIDASFCSNYGKLLSAMFMDANHHIQPIACHFCGEETGVDYILLLTFLMEAGLSKRPYIVFNSDGSAAINMAITSVMNEYKLTNYKHVICSQHIFRHVAAKLAKDEKVSSETDEGKKVYKELKKNYWHARYAGTKEVCRKYMDRIKEDHPSIHEYIMDWGDSQFFYTHDQPHFSQDTNNPCESLNGRMRLKTDLEESIRNSNCYNIIHRFIVLALTFSTRRLECLELRPDPKPQSNEVPPPNPTWCQYICKALPRVGHHAVVKGTSVFEICREEEAEEGCGGGEECSRVYFVHDNSWNEEFKVEFSRRRFGCRCG